MEFQLHNRQHVFILGAGASVDYNLPTWKDLSNLIKNKIENEKDNQKYKYREEILDWLNKIGDGKKYKTIDECIKMESISSNYHENGHEIEDEIFRIVKEVFEEVYKANEVGWIRQLNEKIKNNERMRLEERIAFVNYNYDDVLDKNLLNFDYLPKKYKLFNYKDRLDVLSSAEIICLHPHGYFPSEFNSSFIIKETETIKTGNEEFLDTVSCYESMGHSVGTSNLTQKIVLYILGLGSGLEINLNNIHFENKILEIHVTVKDKEKKDQVLSFLGDKFKVDPTGIKIYKDCVDLVSNCFTEKN